MSDLTLYRRGQQTTTTSVFAGGGETLSPFYSVSLRLDTQSRLSRGEERQRQCRYPKKAVLTATHCMGRHCQGPESLRERAGKCHNRNRASGSHCRLESAAGAPWQLPAVLPLSGDEHHPAAAVLPDPDQVLLLPGSRYFPAYRNPVTAIISRSYHLISLLNLGQLSSSLISSLHGFCPGLIMHFPGSSGLKYNIGHLKSA